jgi:hypothetical protein
MTAGPNTGNQTPDPNAGSPGPAAEFLRQLQIESGVLSADNAPAGTSGAGNQGGAAAGAGGGGKSPAPSSAASGNDAMMQMLAKINARLDAQSQYLQKVQGTQAQMRQDFENRFKQTRQADGRFAPTPDNEPPEMNPEFIVKTVTEGVLSQLGETLRPLVEQTAATSAMQRVMQAQYDPSVKQMVDELPAPVRANLAKEVHRLVGNKMFEEKDPLFDGPDPVNEAIELIHYRTVVKAGGRPSGETRQPGGEPPRQTFSPVPDTGTRDATPQPSEQEQLFEQMFGVKLGPDRMRYPASIERERGLS